MPTTALTNAQWNGTLDGYTPYSRASLRAFYTAYLEREVALLGVSTEWNAGGFGVGYDPVDDDHSYVAAVQADYPRNTYDAFGGIGWLFDVFYRVVTCEAYRWGTWSKADADIHPTDNYDGTDFVTRIGRRGVMAAIGGNVRRVVPLIVASLTVGQDQFGQTVAVGAKGYGTIDSGPWAGGNRVVEWSGSAWTAVVPQMPARPDMIEAGEIAPENPISDYDPADPDAPAFPDGNGYRDYLGVGDYMGNHLWTQIRDTFNLLTKFFHAGGTFSATTENYHLNGSYTVCAPVWIDPLHRVPASPPPGFADPPPPYGSEPILSGHRRTAITNENVPNPSIEGWAAVVDRAKSLWDGTYPGQSPPDDIYGLFPFATSEAHAYWSYTTAGSPPAVVQWVQHQLALQSVRSEVVWTSVATYTPVKLTSWVYAQKPAIPVKGAGGLVSIIGSVPVSDIVFDAASSGLTENQWNKVSEHTTTGDLTPDSEKFKSYISGDFVGFGDGGDYPGLSMPPDPSPGPDNPYTVHGAGAPTATGTGWIVGQFGYNADGDYSNRYPAGVADWKDGFTYKP